VSHTKPINGNVFVFPVTFIANRRQPTKHFAILCYYNIYVCRLAIESHWQTGYLLCLTVKSHIATVHFTTVFCHFCQQLQQKPRVLSVLLVCLACTTTDVWVKSLVTMLRAVDGFALSLDRAALMDDRSLAPPSTDGATINRWRSLALLRGRHQPGCCPSTAQRCRSPAHVRRQRVTHTKPLLVLLLEATYRPIGRAETHIYRLSFVAFFLL